MKILGANCMKHACTRHTYHDSSARTASWRKLLEYKWASPLPNQQPATMILHGSVSQDPHDEALTTRSLPKECNF